MPCKYSCFLVYWRNMFPGVKIRQYIGVGGKCQICADIKNLRRSVKGYALQEAVTALIGYHRGAYMSQRISYYERKFQSSSYPTYFASYILDGMSQSHCELPYLGNCNTFTELLPQHLQGILAHGKSCNIYR